MHIHGLSPLLTVRHGGLPPGHAGASVAGRPQRILRVEPLLLCDRGAVAFEDAATILRLRTRGFFSNPEGFPVERFGPSGFPETKQMAPARKPKSRYFGKYPGILGYSRAQVPIGDDRDPTPVRDPSLLLLLRCVRILPS